MSPSELCSAQKKGLPDPESSGPDRPCIFMLRFCNL